MLLVHGRQIDTFQTDHGEYVEEIRVPNNAHPGEYDLHVIWFDRCTGDYVASPIVLLIVTP
jgi:hypothetical protein